MDFVIVQDADKSAGLSCFLDIIRSEGLREYFSDKKYNDADTDLGVILMCRQPYHHFKQRIRHSKKTNTLYIDLMLDLKAMASMPSRQKIETIGTKMLEELPPIIAKYRQLDFDVLRFSLDLREWFDDKDVVKDFQ